MTSLLKSIALQVRVIQALIMREIHTRYGRENIGFLWVVGEPIMFCGGVAVLWTAIRPAHEHGVAVTAFVVTGYVPLTMWRHCIGRALKAFESNGSLLFHRQVTPLDIITARVILEIAGTLMAGMVVMFGATVTGFMEAPYNLGYIYLGLLYQAFFCYASALIVAALSEVSDVVEKAISPILYLSLPFSGAFTMVDWVPPAFQHIMLWSPPVHNMELVRLGQFGPAVHPIYDLQYDTWVTALMMLVGLSMTLRVRRHLVVQ